MKRFFSGTMIAVLLLSTEILRAALLLPHLGPVRSAIVTNMAFLTNAAELSPAQRRQGQLLQQALNAIDRPGRASVVNDAQVLANVGSLLSRAFPNGDFDAVLLSSLANYRATLIDAALTLSTDIDRLPRSDSTLAAASAVGDAMSMLDHIDNAGDLSAGTRTLATAAVRLRSVQGLMTRISPVAPRASELTARIEGRTFRANEPTGLSAVHNAAAKSVTVSGRELSGVPASSRTIKLFISNVTPGTTTHSLASPGTGSYAFYSVNSPTNSADYTSLSGTAIVTFDATAKTISGRFSFEGADALQMNALVRLSSGNFFLRLQ